MCNRCTKNYDVPLCMLPLGLWYSRETLGVEDADAAKPSVIPKAVKRRKTPIRPFYDALTIVVRGI